MSQDIHILLAQINTKVGDMAYNYNKIIVAYRKAIKLKADIVIFPECCLSGYPLKDQVFNTVFLQKLHEHIEKLAKITNKDCALIIGSPSQYEQTIFNSLFFLYDKTIQAIRHKTHLPNYGVFDEKRIYTSNPQTNECIHFKGIKLAIGICEDMWEKNFVTDVFKPQKPDCAIFINASPYQTNKITERKELAHNITSQIKCPLIYINQVGGQDELIFDGHSFILNADGTVLHYMKGFVEDYVVCKLTIDTHNKKTLTALPISVSPEHTETHKCKTELQTEFHHTHALSSSQNDYLALVHGLRDYIEKNNFKTVILGISGGIDSALCATLAVDAIGSDNVTGFLLPSIISSQHSIDDAKKLADDLSIRHDTLSIDSLVETCEKTLISIIKDTPRDITEENIQSRLRGVLLMAIANKTGALLLTTGNKSELAVGYATLYGDTNGGFNPIKDVYKSYVYTLAHLRNSWYHPLMKGKNERCITLDIINKPPSAELSVNQYDQDTLPDYDILDEILKALIEKNGDIESLYKKGYRHELINDIQYKLYRSEHKRHQAAPGTKITRLAFGTDRRYPITNGYTNNI